MGIHPAQLLFANVKKEELDMLVDEYHIKINELGEKGWELVDISGGDVHVFKRKL